MSTATLHCNKNGAREVQSLRSRGVPLLLNGDHLAVPEFERRYYAMPETKKVELIEGVVAMPSATSPVHGRSHGVLTELISRYARTSAALDFGVNVSVRLDGKNEYQPDVVLRIKEGGLAGTRIGADGLIDGPPEFVAEIAVSSAGYDLHEKKAVYQRSMVREYFVWQAMDSEIHWFALEQGEFVELMPRHDGTICSLAFPGLWLNVQAMLAGNEDKVARTLDKGIKSPEHRSFLKRLADKIKS